ncbi:serine/threonine-protein kinase [Nocardia caishijiensis]|uniref:non-specific serine/threonine protein kinase n=1 Tax=Nocardia caishijiensis TaxID=184756 RepID=A0ABQ6YFD8_9NOCA|nr:serine/threonine-protein kinase [Nocardia caishijiensis]KAF0836607.1 serine/threonine-protein kinase [Nocardia caishijiensis]
MLQTGASFAGYHLEGVLGQGGMGTVYLARHPRLPRSVALKVLNREFGADHELQRRFEREADVVAQLEHPGIVGIYDRGTDDGYLWIAMQCVRGTDAATWDARAHDPAVTARLVGETASALDYANQHGVLHRDVKPGNILIAEADHGREIRSVLTDFGIARVTTANTQLTATGTFTATLAYASPEQLSGEVVDHRSDQYSLACTVFAMYAGHPPYTATNPGQVVAGHLSQPVPRLTSVRPDLPQAVDVVIARAMAKRRDERFVSSTEFASALRDAIEGRPITTGRPPAHISDGHLLQPRPALPAYGPHTPESSAQQLWVGPGQHTPVGSHAQQPWVDFASQPGDARNGYQPSGMKQSAPVGNAWQQPTAAANPWNPAPVHEPAPSKAGAVFSGVLSLLISLGFLMFLLYGISETLVQLEEGSDPRGSFIAIAVIIGIITFTAAGGILLLCARTAGRVMTIMTAGFVALIAAIAGAGSIVEKVYAGTAVAVLVLALMVAMVVGVAAPATGRWVRHRKELRARW